jgi:hypothetical protein
MEDHLRQKLLSDPDVSNGYANYRPQRMSHRCMPARLGFPVSARTDLKLEPTANEVLALEASVLAGLTLCTRRVLDGAAVGRRVLKRAPR